MEIGRKSVRKIRQRGESKLDLFLSFFLFSGTKFLLTRYISCAILATVMEQKETKKKAAKIVDPMEEKQDLGVTVKLGKTHYEALMRWSKERFGLPNHAGLVRLLIHDRWLQEQKEKEHATT